MTIVKVSELTGTALDWAVAKCEEELIWHGHQAFAWCDPKTSDDTVRVIFQPSTDWAQGGPIIEREKISVSSQTNGHDWVAKGLHNYSYGPTPLIAAMRCYVASKLGDSVDIPVELIGV